MLALLVALAVGGAACSSDTGTSSDDDSSSGPTSSTTSVPAPSEAPSGEPLERYAGYSSEVYADESAWLCHPDNRDICDEGLDHTVVEEDGTLSVVEWTPAQDPPVDCFYVYPTVSQDRSTVSDMEASDDQEGFAALNQVARLGERCRVFAPIYRQRTLTALASRLAGEPATEDKADEKADEGADEQGATDPDVTYSDVLAAWKHYMANSNDGRGVVLLGHSQGAALLRQLIAEEIDPNDDVRGSLVAAYLAGWSVQVPPGKDVGGDFQHVPLCRSEDQTGCVVTWSTYRAGTPPPPDALFGRSSGDGSTVAGCNNPAALSGGRSELDARFPAHPTASLLASLGVSGDGSTWLDPSVGSVDTPFVATPGLVHGECVEHDGFHYLEIHVRPGDGPRVDDIGGDLTPQWGLHLQDVNLVMGDMSELVAAQAAAWVRGGG